MGRSNEIGKSWAKTGGGPVSEKSAVLQTAKELWLDYWFLTREMSKFLMKKEWELFYELMRQRQIMQARIQQADDDFKTTQEGRKLIFEIQQENNAIRQRLQFNLNRLKQHEQVSRAYDGVEIAVRPMTGRRLDAKR